VPDPRQNGFPPYSHIRHIIEIWAGSRSHAENAAELFMSARLSASAGLAIRKLRLAGGWTLAQLSEKSGVPFSTLSKVELGQTGSMRLSLSSPGSAGV
jgi:hypothetical protein